MAVELEFLNLIIPIANIKRAKGAEVDRILLSLREGGGFADFVDWHDDFLYRTGTMGGENDVEDWIAEWTERGLQPIGERNGEKYWKDICVATNLQGPTLPCDWLEYDPWNRCVYLKGQARGLIVGRVGIVESCDEVWEETISAFKRERFQSAMLLLRGLAAMGYVKAQNALADLLTNGEFSERRILKDCDPQEGHTWRLQAADKGFWPSCRSLIAEYLGAPDPLAKLDQMKEWITQGAEQGVPQLQRPYYRAEACLYLSALYRNALGFDANEALSVQCIKRALETHDGALEHLHMGMCYETGYAVLRNLLQAQAHYAKAVQSFPQHSERLAAGNALAAGDTVRACLELAQSHLAWRDPIALLLIYPVAQRGHAFAQYLLGQMYRGGWGIATNEDQAMHWYAKSAAQGYEAALKAVAHDPQWRAYLGEPFP